MIKLTNINKYYRSQSEKYHALKDINLTLPDVGMVYIVGKSGSGKSTLLNIIGGIDAYDSGKLEIINTTEGKDHQPLVDTLNTEKFKRSDYNAYRNTYIGFIFQEFNVVKNLTVYENIALSLDLKQESVKDHHEEILKIIDRVGLSGKHKRRINELSGGERQRVAIARALIKNPQVIIADEPTGNLDSKNRDIVMDILKDLSKEKLILIVTHDKTLANKYGDREITIRDGAIVDDVIIHQENLQERITDYKLTPISPKAKVSFKLALTYFKLNKIRFMFIIFLFSLSLIFAGSVVNLYLADTTKEYANYQKEYGNRYVYLSDKYNYHDVISTTAFFNYDLKNTKDYFNVGEDSKMVTYTTMHINAPIDQNIELSLLDNPNNFFKNEITTITRYSSKDNLLEGFTIAKEDYAIPSNTSIYCYITDYLAESLLINNYYNEMFNTANIIGKVIELPGLKSKIKIAGIIDTNYETFLNANNDGSMEKDIKLKASFEDNLQIYNSIFVSDDVFKNMYSHTNVEYYYDDILYYSSNTITPYNNIKFSIINSSTFLLTKEVDGVTVPCGSFPEKPQQGEVTKVAVSKGFLKEILGYDESDLTIEQKTNQKTGITTYNLTIDGKKTYNHYLCGTRRVPCPFEFTISGIIDSDEVVIYAPRYATYGIYSGWINQSFVDGGFITASISEDTETNSLVYRNLLNNNVAINNPSFIKLQIVDNFISDNLFLFAALFFAFCLFSVLMIFNFIIINIKNSQRDIGIYMSLGMNGFKISLIYLFQVMIISTISCLIGLIGSAIFLNAIDLSFSRQAFIDFKIIKYTFLGIIFVFVLAYLTPIIAIGQPLLSLSRKKPIDIIKVS